MEEKQNGIGWRIMLTGILLVVFTAFNLLINKAAPVMTGPMATSQLQNSDSAYVFSQVGMSLINGVGLPIGILLIGLIAVWWGPTRKLFASLAIIGMLLCGGPGYAYYDIKDNPEFVEIQPQQTAVLIPVGGANKTSQAKFMSEEYLTENKVAAKRIQIPHVLVKTTWDQRDYYVPAAKLIIVDRTSFNKEWTKDAHRGTSTRDEALRCESADSVNIATDITIAASIEEANAFKYLYYFGTGTLKNPQDPASMFASVVYARTLGDVMDTVGRGKVQAVLAREFGKLSTEDAIHKKADVIAAVEKEVKEYFAGKGITVEYIGYANSLTFDDPVQKAINDAYIATKKAAMAEAQAKMIPTLDQLANIEMKKAVAVVAAKWNGQIPALPSWVILPESMGGWFSGLTRDKK